MVDLINRLVNDNLIRPAIERPNPESIAITALYNPLGLKYKTLLGEIRTFTELDESIPYHIRSPARLPRVDVVNQFYGWDAFLHGRSKEHVAIFSGGGMRESGKTRSILSQTLGKLLPG